MIITHPETGDIVVTEPEVLRFVPLVEAFILMKEELQKQCDLCTIDHEAEPEMVELCKEGKQAIGQPIHDALWNEIYTTLPCNRNWGWELTAGEDDQGKFIKLKRSNLRYRGCPIDEFKLNNEQFDWINARRQHIRSLIDSKHVEYALSGQAERDKDALWAHIAEFVPEVATYRAIIDYKNQRIVFNDLVDTINNNGEE